MTARLTDQPSRCYDLFYHLRQQWDGIGDAPGQRIRRTQGRRHPGDPGQKACVLTEAHGPFKPRERPEEVTLAELQHTDPPEGIHQATWVVNCLGNPESLFPEGTALSEHAELGMACGEVGTGVDGGEEDKPQALAAPCPVEGRHGLFVTVDRPTIVTVSLIGIA